MYPHRRGRRLGSALWSPASEISLRLLERNPDLPIDAAWWRHRIHDAAAGNIAPDATAGDPDAPATGITLSTVADTVANNYATCHAIREQVIALQAYIHSLPTTTSP